MSASTAALPESIEGLRRQNRAYRALCVSLEAQMGILTEKGREFQEAVTTLDSEREANAILTAENARLTEERDALVEAVERARRHAENIGITDGGYIAQLDEALAKVKGGPDA